MTGTAAVSVLDALEPVRGRVQSELRRVSAAIGPLGMAVPEPEGQLIRPLVALAGSEMGTGSSGAPDGFWEAALAIQLAHEASLVHDDVVDAAETRRGRPTAVAAGGVGFALVKGDHLLTSAYRVAAGAGSLTFAAMFARALERTVAGELLQAGCRNQVLDWVRYREVAGGKSGELLGCALATAATLRGDPGSEALYAVGRRVGLVYQMLDDLLDYCPEAEIGKPALSDHARGHWTWPLLELPGNPLQLPTRDVVAMLHASDGSASPLERCLERLREEADGCLADAAREAGASPILQALLSQWLERAGSAVAGGRSPGRSPGRPRASATLVARVPAPEEVSAFFARNSRSFRLASRLFPRAEADRIARIYAYCRVTDDLVDRPAEGESAEDLLDEWMRLTRRAYDGERTGVQLLDRVAAEAAEAGVPLQHLTDLGEGMRMDLRGVRYASMDELRVYTHRVASVVGLWITRLSGVRDPVTLQRAASLGHAMQLTNIVRDVGEDLQQGRVYLPADRMRQHGVSEADLQRWAGGDGSPSDAYSSLIEEMLEAAERQYARAFAGIPGLPAAYRQPVAVAAYVYRGIHARVRSTGYDNLTRRAVTPLPLKLRLAGRALLDLWLLQRPGAAALPVGRPTPAVPLLTTSGTGRKR